MSEVQSKAKRLRELRGKATQGEWKEFRLQDDYEELWIRCDGTTVARVRHDANNAAFIAAAANDLPAILALKVIRMATRGYPMPAEWEEIVKAAHEVPLAHQQIEWEGPTLNTRIAVSTRRSFEELAESVRAFGDGKAEGGR